MTSDRRRRPPSKLASRTQSSGRQFREGDKADPHGKCHRLQQLKPTTGGHGIPEMTRALQLPQACLVPHRAARGRPRKRVDHQLGTHMSSQEGGMHLMRQLLKHARNVPLACLVSHRAVRGIPQVLQIRLRTTEWRHRVCKNPTAQTPLRKDCSKKSIS